MKLPIFVSLTFAAGVASFGASACNTRADYSNKINKSQTEYQAAVDQANNAYVEKMVYSVRPRNADLAELRRLEHF
jgi:hypothetical protein